MVRTRFFVFLIAIAAVVAFFMPGCDTLVTEQITEPIQLYPTADFRTAQGSRDSGCVPLEVTFDDVTAGQIVSWAWIFGDGGDTLKYTDPATVPQHTYTEKGTYQVTLVVIDTNGIADIETKKRFIIAGQAVDSFTFRNDSSVAGIIDTVGCPGDTFWFEPVDPWGVPESGWKWDFGDSDSSLDQVAFHVYDSIGVYSVKVRSQGECGQDSVLYTDLIRITECPVAEFTTSVNSGCANMNVVFEDISTPPSDGAIIEWVWDFDNGSQPVVYSAVAPSDTTVKYATVDTFVPSLMVTSSTGGTSTYYDTIITSPIGSAIFTALPVAACESPNRQFLVQFTDASTSAVSWDWSFGDGMVSTEQSPVHAYTQPGRYSVSLTIDGPCGISSTSLSDLIVFQDRLADPGFTMADSLGVLIDTIALDSLITFVDTSATAVFKDWFWEFGDDTTRLVDSNLVEHRYSRVVGIAYPADYWITLTVFNGCDSLTVFDTITVIDLGP